MVLTFIEKAGNPDEPGGAGHAMEAQKANAYYLLNQGSGDGGSLLATDILAAITQILGTTNYNLGNGGLNRTLPLYHPLYTNLYATTITRMWGMGKQSPVDALFPINIIGLAGSTISQFALYNQYWFAVDFLPRDYPVVSDSNILLTQSSYYDDTNTQYTINYFPEWYRFCDSVAKPAPSNDTNLTQYGGLYGTMQFVTGSTDPPNGVTFPGAFQVLLPNQLVTVMWYNVPLRYISSHTSYIAQLQWRNRVNQNPIQFAKFQAAPGELLYLGFDFKSFSIPNPQAVTLFNSLLAPGQLCNINLYFLQTSRMCSDPPETVGDTFQIPGKNSNIANGHNLLYNFAQKNYYYATTTTTNLPTYRSFPMEILFTDPDFSGGINL